MHGPDQVCRTTVPTGFTVSVRQTRRTATGSSSDVNGDPKTELALQKMERELCCSFCVTEITFLKFLFI